MLRIITTLYNAADYIERCIDSIKNQSYTNWKCYITDDISTDGSESYAELLIDSDNRFELIKNTKKQYQPGNIYQVLQKSEVDSQDICLLVDGDDWLPDNEVFSRIATEYLDNNLWITWGQYQIFLGPNMLFPGMSAEPDWKNVRKFNHWVLSHLRTFKVFLFKEIKVEDLKAPSGEFWEVAGDLAFMLPMVEMAGKEHSKYLSKINYIYNQENPLNDHKVHLSQQLQYKEMIKKKDPYKKLEF